MTQPLVKLDSVDVALDGRLVLHNINWTLFPRQHWAVLGSNGSGKSTLLRLIRGELWPAPGSPGKRTYAFDGEQQFTAVGIRELIALVSPELQDRYLQQEWTLNAGQTVSSGVRGGDYVYENLTLAQRRHVHVISRRLGVDTLLSRNVQTLSTGELRKVLIARALAGSPRVLICDEICDGLDANSRGRLLETLAQVARSGTQLLYTTHREDEEISFLTHRLRLSAGRIVENRTQPGRLKRDAGDKIRAERKMTGVGRLRRSRSQPKPTAATASTQAKRLIEIQETDVYVGTKRALRAVDFEISAGQHWAIVGPNGSGKSTLLKLILGDLHPALGSRVRRFTFTARNSIWEVKRKIGYISPELQSNYHASMTGEGVVGSGFFSSIGPTKRRLTQRQKERVTCRLRIDGLEHLAEKSILQMSYGEFRKILLARALVHDPELLLCDEPFDGLDRAARTDMTRALDEVAKRGATLVVVTHHHDDLPDCVTYRAELREGRVISQGRAG